MDKIKAIYKDYNEIVRHFTREKVDKRYDELFANLKIFIKKNNIEKETFINEFSLMHALMDYFTDIYRLKNLHGINKVNEYKIIAYTVYWILKRHPIQLKSSNKNEDMVFINEKFATSYIYTEMVKVLPDDYYEKLGEINKATVDAFLESLFYYLKYRTFTAQDLEMLLLAFYTGLAINENEQQVLENQKIGQILKEKVLDDFSNQNEKAKNA